MATRRPKTVAYRRKREGRTNYLKRLKLLLSRKKRIVVRLSNKRVYAQLVEFTTSGDKVLAVADSFALKKSGWNHSCKNIPAAYLTGLSFGKKALEINQKEAILDFGDNIPLHKGKMYAFLKGVLDAGMDVPHTKNKDIFPTEGRLKGEHLKSKAEPKKVAEEFENIKQKIIGK